LKVEKGVRKRDEERDRKGTEIMVERWTVEKKPYN